MGCQLCFRKVPPEVPGGGYKKIHANYFPVSPLHSTAGTFGVCYMRRACPVRVPLCWPYHQGGATPHASPTHSLPQDRIDLDRLHKRLQGLTEQVTIDGAYGTKKIHPGTITLSRHNSGLEIGPKQKGDNCDMKTRDKSLEAAPNFLWQSLRNINVLQNLWDCPPTCDGMKRSRTCSNAKL